MAATGLLAVFATTCAGIGGFSLVRAWCSGEQGRRGVALRPDRGSRIARRLGRGCKPLEPLARWLLELTAVRNAMADLAAVVARTMRQEEEESPAPGAEALLSTVTAAVLLVGVVVSVATGSVVCGGACAACAVIGVFARARAAQEKHVAAMREEVPEGLRSMSVCFRAGLSLLQTLKQVAQELDGSLGKLFETAARRLEMGATTTEALAVFDTARQLPELRFVAVALDAQHQSGGSIAAVLESAQESVESELELRRSLRVQTAQAKLSARIVTLMPFLLVALFSLMSPGFLEPFFTSFAGMALLGLALGMQLAGTLMVHRMLKANAE